MTIREPRERYRHLAALTFRYTAAGQQDTTPSRAGIRWRRLGVKIWLGHPRIRRTAPGLRLPRLRADESPRKAGPQ